MPAPVAVQTRGGGGVRTKNCHSLIAQYRKIDEVRGITALLAARSFRTRIGLRADSTCVADSSHLLPGRC